MKEQIVFFFLCMFSLRKKNEENFFSLGFTQNKVFRTRLRSFKTWQTKTAAWKQVEQWRNVAAGEMQTFISSVSLSRTCRRPSTATSVWWSPSTWAAVTSCGATAPSCRSSRRLSARPITAGRRPAAAWRAGRGGCTLHSCSVRWDTETFTPNSDLTPTLTSDLFFFCRSSTRRCTLCCCGSLRPRTNWTPWTSAACRRRAPSCWSTAARWRWEHQTSSRLDYQHNLLCATITSAYLFAVAWCWNQQELNNTDQLTLYTDLSKLYFSQLCVL